MKLALCTISFRHQLVSFAQLARFAIEQQFHGIELWGTHALGLMRAEEQQRTLETLDNLQNAGLSISMVSDYLDITGGVDFSSEQLRCRELVKLAKLYGAPRLRTFAGNRGSAAVSKEEYSGQISRLIQLCDICQEAGIELIVETHPGTLLDNRASILRLLEDVQHPAMSLNYDVLHIWEGYSDPAQFYVEIASRVGYFHLKNVTSRARLSVFAPAAVYAANGNREGMCSLAEGAVNYEKLLPILAASQHFAGIEWFGGKPYETLREEMGWLRSQLQAAGHGASGGADPNLSPILAQS